MPSTGLKSLHNCGVHDDPSEQPPGGFLGEKNCAPTGELSDVTYQEEADWLFACMVAEAEKITGRKLP